MPFGDKTGPQGQGPRTGRGLGFCAGYETPGSMNTAVGFGRGRGGRGGRGGGNRFRAQGVTPIATPATVAHAGGQPEVAELKTTLNSLLTAVNQIQQRLDGLEAAQKGA